MRILFTLMQALYRHTYRFTQKKKLSLFQVGKHDKMGMNVVPLKDLTPEEPKTLTLDLLKNMDSNDPQNEKMRGQLVVEVVYQPFKEGDTDEDMSDDSTNANMAKAPEGTPAGGGLLVVTVHEAQDLEGKHHTNPFVRLLLKGEERKTKVCSCPLWFFCK